jgi:hypothetical protein
MAKNLSGDLSVASANRLTDGVVVFLDDAGEWTRRLDRAAVAGDKRSGETLLESAKAKAFAVVDSYIVAVSETKDGIRVPLSSGKDPRFGAHLRRHRGVRCVMPVSTVTTTTTVRWSPSASSSSATRCAARSGGSRGTVQTLD